mgnify:CR=1 FL=1
MDGLQDIWKIPSGEITNYPYLVEIAKTGQEIILSTGMSTLEEIDHAVEILGEDNLVIYHCTSTYPTNANEANLNVIKYYKEKYNYISYNLGKTH